MKTRFDKIRDSFNEATEYCELCGLNWREHMYPLFKNGMVAGYYVLDETKSTTVKTIRV